MEMTGIMSSVDLSILAISPDIPGFPLATCLAGLAEGGISAFMFREKRLSDEEFLREGVKLRQLCDDLGIHFILNERVELAELVGARIVHLTYRSRGRIPGDQAEVRVGRSVHTVQEAHLAEDAGADYLVAGPVFPTPSKEGLVPVLGVDGLRQVTAAVSLPVVAVGGMEAAKLPALADCGVCGAAAISAFFFGDSPRGAAQEFVKIMGETWCR